MKKNVFIVVLVLLKSINFGHIYTKKSGLLGIKFQNFLTVMRKKIFFLPFLWFFVLFFILFVIQKFFPMKLGKKNQFFHSFFLFRNNVTILKICFYLVTKNVQKKLLQTFIIFSFCFLQFCCCSYLNQTC